MIIISLKYGLIILRHSLIESFVLISFTFMFNIIATKSHWLLLVYNNLHQLTNQINLFLCIQYCHDQNTFSVQKDSFLIRGDIFQSPLFFS